MIELQNVSKTYGTKVAVVDLNLHIEAGELFAFLGPNGAGKTTTLKLMCGLLFPTTGTIRVGGYEMQTDGDRARQLISFVPDQPYLYEKLTGREFLQFIADMYGMPRTDSRPRIDEMIDLFTLGDFVDELTERYSHGMKQRTVFAAAFLHDPKILIVDEPTVGLDPR
ncbi:MAG: ABC transporter ATP-binding protein, partial [Planctomycetes bacterium]|nr:ABC transporter ATP-binding protein [Planctomycetota bacterium]